MKSLQALLQANGDVNQAVNNVLSGAGGGTSGGGYGTLERGSNGGGQPPTTTRRGPRGTMSKVVVEFNGVYLRPIDFPPLANTMKTLKLHLDGGHACIATLLTHGMFVCVAGPTNYGKAQVSSNARTIEEFELPANLQTVRAPKMLRLLSSSWFMFSHSCPCSGAGQLCEGLELPPRGSGSHSGTRGISAQPKCERNWPYRRCTAQTRPHRF